MANDKIVEILDEWGLELVNDLKASLDKYYPNEQETALAGSINYKVLNSNGKYTFALSMNEYWKWANDGRAKGKKGVPLDAVGKLWQNKLGIDARKVLFDMAVKSGKKPKSKNTIAYEKATKTLAFLIQRSIKKKGIKPRPFYDDVVTEQRIKDLKTKLTQAIREDLLINIK